VQSKDKINLSASRVVAVCELSFATGEPDYTGILPVHLLDGAHTQEAIDTQM
jgi:hypothetical protein